MKSNLGARVTAETLGTAFLVAAVVGSGIMAERLANGNMALALLANTLATAAALVALILAFGPISGAHFNPVVSLADAMEGGLSWLDALRYAAAQVFGGIGGTIAAHAMFGLALVSRSHRVRGGPAQFLSEFIATFGLLCVVWGCSRSRTNVVPFAVGSYIAAAYWFSASTSFANPAVTIARSLSDTFAGIRPDDVPLFIVAQVSGGVAATFLFRWLFPRWPGRANNLVLPHDDKSRAEEFHAENERAGIESRKMNTSQWSPTLASTFDVANVRPHLKKRNLRICNVTRQNPADRLTR